MFLIGTGVTSADVDFEILVLLIQNVVVGDVELPIKVWKSIVWRRSQRWHLSYVDSKFLFKLWNKLEASTNIVVRATKAKISKKISPSNHPITLLSFWCFFVAGKYVNHKGRSRHFTSFEELEEERKNKLKKQQERGDDDSSEEEEDDDKASDDGSDESDSDESDDENKKAKGVSGLIEIENPNRIQKKSAEKVTKLNTAGPSKPELSRREREELEKQKAQAHYQKLHAEGKTDQARADLARLAIIKQHRAEAAARREAEKKGLDFPLDFVGWFSHFSRFLFPEKEEKTKKT